MIFAITSSSSMLSPSGAGYPDPRTTEAAKCDCPSTGPVLAGREEERLMRHYGKKASAKVEKAMGERKRGTLKSGRSGKKVTSRKQAIAIGLSEARREGAKVPRRAGARRRKK